MTYTKKSYKKFVATAASATLVASAIVPVVSAASFSDVEETHEFATYIDAAVEAGYIKGYTDGTFGVNDNLKRSQVVIIIGRYLESLGYDSEATTSPWSDVTDEEVIKYGNIVKDAGVFTGYADGTLNGNAFITRENMAVVLDRLAATVTGISLSEVAEEIEDVEIADLANANADYQASIQALRDLEISTADNFNPKGNLKRGQFAKFIVTAVETIDAIAEEVTELVVESVTAVNGTITVTLEEAYEEVYVENFTVTQAINGGEAKEVTPSKAELSEDGKTVTLTVDQVAQVDAAQSVVYTVNGVAAKAFVVEASELKVESVTAINGKQIQVKFSKPVAQSSIISGGKLVNDKVTLSGLTTDNTVDAALDSTNTVLTITLKSGQQLAKNTDYTFTIKGVTDAEGKPFPHYATSLTATETVAPAIKSVTAVTKDTVTRTVTLTLTEPVTQPTVKVNGKFVGVAKVSDSVYTLTTTEDLEIDKSYEVEVIGLTDVLGNAANNSLKTNVTVTRDTVKPTFTVKVVNEKTIDVVFDKEVNAASIAVDSFKVTKLLSDGTTNQTIAQASLGVLQKDKKTVRLTLSGDVFDSATQTSREISVAVSGITDTVGNAVTAKTEKLTVTRDVVKPTVISVTQTFNNATSLKVAFSEAVIGMGTSAGDVFTVVDANGNQVLVGGSAVTATVGSSSSTLTDGQNIATVELSKALPKSGTYKLVAKQGSISDTAGKANKNDAQTVSFAYTVPAATVGTLTATITNDKNGSASGQDVTDSGEAANRVVFVEFSRADVVNGFDAATGTYKAGAADNPANFTVAGTPLPEGTTVTFVADVAGDGQKAGVKLDFSAVAYKDLPVALKAGGKLAVSVANVKAETGVALSYTTTEIVVKDTTAPTVTAAYLSGDVSEQTLKLELTFSENVDISSVTAGKFTVGFITGAGTESTTVDTGTPEFVGTAKNKVVLTLTQASALDIDLTKPVKLTIASDSGITDTAKWDGLSATNGLTATTVDIAVDVFATQ